jgi:hypothetical protein
VLWELTMSSLEWGLIGTNVYGLLSQGRGFGVIRDNVGTAVDYQAPPLPPECRVWSRVGEKFEMLLDDRGAHAVVNGLGDLRARSLCDLHKQLRQARARPEPDQRLLGELDAFADRFLEVVEYLHDHRGGLGLLRPPGVVLREEDGELRVLLLDLGFVRRPDAWGGVPDWADESDDKTRRWRELWDMGDLLRLQTEGGPAHDLRKVARLFAWLLLGKVRRNIPGRDEEPSTYAPVWNDLADAVEGKIASAAELREALRRHPLSDHFRPEPKHPGEKGWSLVGLPWPGGRPALLGSAVVLFGALVAGAAWWGQHYVKEAPAAQAPGQPAAADAFPPNPERPLPPESRLHEPLAAYRGADSTQGRIDAVRALYRARPAYDPEAQQAEAHAREKVRLELLGELKKLLEDARRDEEERSHLLPQSLRTFEQVRDWLVILRGLKAHEDLEREEEQCLAFCRKWLARQYDLG